MSVVLCWCKEMLIHSKLEVNFHNLVVKSNSDVKGSVFLYQSRSGLLRRLAAIIYDVILLSGILIINTAMVLGLVIFIFGSDFTKAHSPLCGSQCFSIYLSLVCFLFYGWFWTHGGQTLGMRAWHLKLQQTSGQCISWRQAFLRFTIGVTWIVPIGYLHNVVGLGANYSLIVGITLLLILLKLRLPDRASETELVVILKN